MHLLYDTLAARLLVMVSDPDVKHSQLMKMLRSMRRVVRIMIETRLWLYQRDMKARMLADPAWRARVIAQLGGFTMIARWRERWTAWHAKGIGGQHRGPRAQKGQSSPQYESSPDKEMKQFCLAPMPSGFYTRRTGFGVGACRPYRSLPPRSPFAKPIPLMADEIMPRAGRTSPQSYGYSNGLQRESDQTQTPPPIFTPP